MPRLEKIIAHALVAIALSISSSAAGQDHDAIRGVPSATPQIGGTTSCAPSCLPTFGPVPGTNGPLSALAVFDDGNGRALYAGGSFTTAGGVAASNIAKWDGASWALLGSGTIGTVYAMTVFDDGSGPALFAGGQFGTAGGVAANNIAKWNGASWTPLGSGTGGIVRALAVFDDGSGPALYAGGFFNAAGGVPANNIAKWNGVTWVSLAAGLTGMSGGSVSALAVFDDGSGISLCAGGYFNSAGGIPANNIAKWNGTNWAPLGSGITGGFNDFLSALTVFDDGSGPALYAAGNFSIAGGVSAHGMAKWNAAHWTPFLSPISTGYVFLLTVLDRGSGPQLYAGGESGTQSGAVVASWSGASWTPVGGGINNNTYTATVYALTVFDDGSGPALFAGGDFATAGAGGANNIAKWNAQTWAPVGNGFNSAVGALTVFDDGSGPALYAGGHFTDASGVAADHVAKWNGTHWAPLASGMSSALPTFTSVNALAVFDDGSGPALYAGGFFGRAGGVIVNDIAKWDGAGWSPLASGMNGTVFSLAVFDDGSGTALFVGGGFTSAGGGAANNVAKWNGSSWAPLGSGMNPGAVVRALTVFDDGSGPALYASGDFTAAGGIPANNIAKWKGASWSPLGSGANSTVHALTAFDDGSGLALYAGGTFTIAGGATAKGTAKWNGANWATLGSGFGMSSSVYALTVFDDGSGAALYAAGSFSGTSQVQKWDATSASWSPLAGGPDPSVYALTGFDDGSGPALFAAGNFTSGSSGDSYLAKWGCSLPAGARTFGSSSPGCTGALAVGVTSSPHIGNAAFAITCTNAPPSAPGVFLAGTALSPPVPIQGVQFWVNPIFAPIFASDPSGHAVFPLPIPASPIFVGGQFDVQLVFLGPNTPPPCPPRALSASNALEITIQP